MAAQSTSVVYDLGFNHYSNAHLFAPGSRMQPDFSRLKSKTLPSLQRLSIARFPGSS